MNRLFAPKFEILLKVDAKKTTGFQPTNYLSYGDCYLTYVGNFLVIERVSNPTETTAESRFTPYNLDDVEAFRYSYELKSYTTR